jgi:hypothetical protein
MVKKEKKKKKKSSNKKIILFVAGTVIVIAAVIVIAIFAINSAKISKFTKIIPKETVREEIMGSKVDIENPKVLSNPLRVADNFAVEDIIKEGQKAGEEAIVVIDNPDASKSAKIPKNASLLLIVNNDLKILGFKPFNPSYFTLGIDLDKFFEDFKGKEPLQFINKFDGIYTDNSDTALLVKNKVREAMTLFYIEKYGEVQYDALTNNEFIFAEKGMKVTPIKAKDIDGNEINFEDFRNYKLFIVGGNPGCGGCVEDIKRLGLEIAKYDTGNVKFIVLSFSSEPGDAQKLLSPLPAGAIGIIDTDRKLAIELKVNSSPYIALVDKDLTLFYRGPGEPTRETLTQLKDFLGGS